MSTYIYVVREELHAGRPIRVSTPAGIRACQKVEILGPSEVVVLEEPLRPEPQREIFVAVRTDSEVRLLNAVALNTKGGA